MERESTLAHLPYMSEGLVPSNILQDGSESLSRSTDSTCTTHRLQDSGDQVRDEDTA
jgi:hypothetical protein